ncbi:iron chaperone [Streptomyces xiamenensis]
MSSAPQSRDWKRKTTSSASSGEGFSEQERAAMKERAAELKTEGRRGRGAAKAAAEEKECLARIAEMPDGDRELAERLHALVTEAAPELAPKLWYGQPAYARNGKVVCFFRSGRMDKTRYTVFGFNETANLDDPSGLWPTSYAITDELSEAAEATLRDLVTRAVS